MAKHIAFSGNTAWGMYNFRGKLLCHMVEEGYRVSVLAPYDDVYSPKLAALGCEMCDMPMNPKGVNPISDANLLYRYYKILKQLKPDISITYTIKPNIYGSLAARWLGIPYLPITTGLGYVFIQRTYITTIVKWLYKWAFKRARHVWFLNNDVIDTFRNEDIVSSDKIQQLPGEGIDLNRFKLRTGERDAAPFVFLLVGRMLMDKGVREYVAAARMLKQKYPDVKFRLLGAVWEGNPATISEEQLREWEREGVVEYYGEVPDVVPHLEQADCVVLPSYREGVPFTLMEGAAMGLPLVATDVPGCREVVVEGYNGFLCPDKNPEKLAEAMERMLNSSAEQRELMGKNGRTLMEEKFDLKLILEQYDRTIEAILSDKK